MKHILVRLLSVAANSALFFVWAYYLALDEFGGLSVAMAGSLLIYTIWDFGENQRGATDLARLVARRKSLAEIYLTRSILTKSYLLVGSAICVLLYGMIFEKNSLIESQSLILAIQTISMLSLSMANPWMAIGLHYESFYLWVSLLPKLSSLLVFGVLMEVGVGPTALNASIANAIVTVTVAAFINRACLFKYGYFNIGATGKIKLPSLKKIRHNLLNSATSLSSLLYSPGLMLLGGYFGTAESVGLFSIADKICRGLIDIVVLGYQVSSASYYKLVTKKEFSLPIINKSLIYGAAFSLLFCVLFYIYGADVLAIIFGEDKTQKIYDATMVLMPIVGIVSFSGWLLVFKMIRVKRYNSALGAYVFCGIAGLISYVAMSAHVNYALEISACIAESMVLIALYRKTKYEMQNM